MNKLVLELYVVGWSARSRAAIANLRRICESRLSPGGYELQVIDVIEHPQAAEDANVLVTPTLIKKEPPPPWRIVGDLSVTSAVLHGLGLEEDRETDGEGRHG